MKEISEIFIFINKISIYFYEQKKKKTKKLTY